MSKVRPKYACHCLWPYCGKSLSPLNNCLLFSSKWQNSKTIFRSWSSIPAIMTIFSSNLKKDKLRGLTATPYSRGLPPDGARLFSIFCALFLSSSLLTTFTTETSPTCSLSRFCTRKRSICLLASEVVSINTTTLTPSIRRRSASMSCESALNSTTLSATMDNQYFIPMVRNQVINVKDI